ncbi:MAG: LPS export ABC transporter permease LptG [bacterium]
MKILSRYIAKEFIKIFLLCFSAVAIIYLLAHFLGKLDEFIEFKAAPSLVATFILLKLPGIFYEVLPVVVLLATLFTLGFLSKNNEITALRSCGTGLAVILLPVFSVVLLLVFLSIADGEWLVPYANQRSTYLDDVALKKRAPILALRKNRIWFHTGENTFCNILKVDPEKKVLNNITLYVFNKDFDLITRMDADQVSWDGRRWTTSDATEWTFTGSGVIEQERHFQGPFPLTVSLEDMIHVEKLPVAMGYAELRDYIRILKRNGYPAAFYEVDLYAKTAYPIISLIMVLLGVPFALQINRSGGVGISIGLSLGIGFIYWVTFAVGLSFGHAGFLPPLLAAWMVNALFGVGGFYWTNRLRY